MSPRVAGAVFAHFVCAARAATTASRASLRDARAMFAPKLFPSQSGSLRPDSERTNVPLMYNLYILRIDSRASAFFDMLVERTTKKLASPRRPAAGFLARLCGNDAKTSAARRLEER